MTTPMIAGRPTYWRLDGHTPVPATLDQFVQVFEGTDRHVALDTVGRSRVSTVFLGLDHAYHGPPMVFETMVFADDEDDEEQGQWRYSTWDEAVAGHERVVAALRAGVAP